VIFTKLIVALKTVCKNFYTGLYENLTNRFVTDTSSRTERRTDEHSLYIRPSFLRRKEHLIIKRLRLFRNSLRVGKGLFWCIGLVTKYQAFTDVNITDKNIVNLRCEIFYLEKQYFHNANFYIPKIIPEDATKKKTNIPEVWRLMQFVEHTNGNFIMISLQTVIIVQTTKICLRRQVKNLNSILYITLHNPRIL